MKIFLTLSLSFLSLSLAAQSSAYWIGGTPGQETQWEVPTNWSTQRVPNEDTRVVIKGTNSGHDAMPVIREEIEVASIAIHHGGRLVIEKGGEILLNGEYTYSEGIVCYGGTLVNEGTISMNGLDQFAVNNVMEHSQGTGRLIRDGAFCSLASNLANK